VALQLSSISAKDWLTSSSERNPLIYVDESGLVGARTIWWREGGIQRLGHDRALSGTGSALVVSVAIFEAVKPHLGKSRCVHIWRSNFGDAEEPDHRLFNGILPD
jgi:hypothetical protein